MKRIILSLCLLCLCAIALPAAESGGSNTVVIYSKTTPLTAAQFQALNTPLTLVPAAGSGKAIIPLSVVLQYNYGTVAYTNGSPGLYLQYPTSAQLLIADGGSQGQIIISGGMVSDFGTVAVSAEWGVPSVTDNAALQLSTAGPSHPYTTGDGTLRVTVNYSIADVS